MQFFQSIRSKLCVVVFFKSERQEIVLQKVKSLDLAGALNGQLFEQNIPRMTSTCSILLI